MNSRVLSSEELSARRWLANRIVLSVFAFLTVMIVAFTIPFTPIAKFFSLIAELSLHHWQLLLVIGLGFAFYGATEAFLFWGRGCRRDTRLERIRFWAGYYSLRALAMPTIAWAAYGRIYSS